MSARASRLVRVMAIAGLMSAGACAGSAMGARAGSAPIPVSPAAAEANTPSLSASAGNARAPGGPASEGAAACGSCTPSSLSSDEEALLARRIAELKAKGGMCAAYAEVLERSFRSGQISVRPFMWRVGAQLASGEAHPDGMIYLAREIDALNVGRRTFDELLWTLEHEAAHIAFNLDAPFDRAPGDRADAVVKSCRSARN